jgi:threonine aldolase
MPEISIELYSDTQTRPTPGMREAMAAAAVGDEQRGEDPSVNRLCETVASMLGMEAAVFLPSGTMCNQIAILVHCRPGDEIIADKTSHIIHSEAGGPAALAGAMVRGIEGERGIFSPQQAEEAIRGLRNNRPRTRMIEVEQTSNAAGGTIWPVEAMQGVGEVARRHGLVAHMDGARLWNAAVATNLSAADHAEPFDTVWVDLSKGLGCPVGAVLAGDAGFIDEAWPWKHRLGGAMRQSGVIAAAGLYALEHHLARLVEDHDNARLFAERIGAIDGITVEAAETNMVFFDVQGTGMTASEVNGRLLAHGVRIGENDRYRMRAVTHLDVSRDQVEQAAEVLADVVGDGAGDV